MWRGGGILALCISALAGPLAADPVQEQLAGIPDTMTSLTLGALNGHIDADRAMAEVEALSAREARLRTGQHTLDDLSLRWRDLGPRPIKAPGAGLVAVGLPPDFAGPVWALLEDGRRIDLIAEQPTDAPHSALIHLPDHPDGDSATGVLTIQFVGAGSLQVALAPRLDIPDALPVLMRLVMHDLVTSLEADGVSVAALVAQFRRDASAVPPELGYAAAAFYIWSEAGRGDPVFGFLRSGRLDGPFWDSLGPRPAPPDALNRLYASALQNSGALERMMRLDRARIDKIRYLVPDPQPQRRVHRVKTQAPTAPPEQVGLRELSDLVITGRGRVYNRKVILESAKSAQKVLDYGSFEPITMTGAAIVGGVLTLTEKHMKAKDHGFPVKIAIKGEGAPAASLLADDERKVFPDIEIVAKGEPYEVRIFSDGLDASLAVLDLASSVTPIGKALNALDKAQDAAEATKQVAKGLNAAETFLLSKATSATKDGLNAIESAGDGQNKGTFNVITVPARTWAAKVEPHNFRRYLSVGYRGEVAWDPRDYHGKACWKNTNEGIAATVMTKADLFGGLFDRSDYSWDVQTPQVTVLAEPARIRPGETTSIVADTSGATKTRVQFSAPSIGDLSAVQDFSAVYGAPDEIRECTELASFSVTFPADGARICAPPPRATGVVIIAKGDAMVRTPARVMCRDGEVVEFAVSHPQGDPLECRLNGPGRLSMAGGTGVLECPVDPVGPSSVTCFTGEQPDQCAPVFPVSRIYPDFAVYAQVTAQRRSGDRLNNEVGGFFRDCGMEDATAAMLDLMDLGTGAADALGVDPVTNACPGAPALAQGALGSGGSPSAFAAGAEGPYVAIWPFGEGRNISVSDSFDYYDPPISWETWERFQGDITASIAFDDPQRFHVRTEGTTLASAADGTPRQPSGGQAEWSVWRRIIVGRDTAVTVNIETAGQAVTLVNVAPMRLVDGVPVSLLAGFDQNPTPAMVVGNAAGGGFIAPRADSSTVTLPGPRDDTDSLTYLLRFGGVVTPAVLGQGQVTAASHTTIAFDIKPVEE